MLGAETTRFLQAGAECQAGAMEAHSEVVRRDLEFLCHGCKGLALQVDAPEQFCIGGTDVGEQPLQTGADGRT